LPITRTLELCAPGILIRELAMVIVFRVDQDMVMSAVQTLATLLASGTRA
jgi:hypothetical protein